MPLIDQAKLDSLANKSLEQIRKLDDEHAHSFLVGLIYQVFIEGENAKKIVVQEIINTGHKKDLH